VASGAAGAVPPSLPGYLASIVTGPLRAVARGVKGKAGAGSSPAPVTGPEAPAVPGHCKTNAAGQAASQGGFPVLNCISGRLRPGTACLILGPPGAGSSSMLRLLSGRLQPSSSMLLGGQLTYNGRSAGQLKALDGVELRKLAAYSPEDDEHEFLLTVRETFDFAYKAAVLPPPADAVAAAAAAASSAAPAAATGGSNAFSFPTGRWTPPDADVMCNIMVRPLRRAPVSAAVRAQLPHSSTCGHTAQPAAPLTHPAPSLPPPRLPPLPSRLPHTAATLCRA